VILPLEPFIERKQTVEAGWPSFAGDGGTAVAYRRLLPADHRGVEPLRGRSHRSPVLGPERGGYHYGHSEGVSCRHAGV